MKAPFQIRNPEPFGGWLVWPVCYPTLAEAIRALYRYGTSNAEIIDATGAVVQHSRDWWRRNGKRGRES